ncbi:hypothetical protein [uncultured Aquimonas sp.]|uniref:hypothetical protein n=1 Tax=uncultured Aquimonas sp. TaxID=385483 RepID=UPI0008697E44|nr:hypothetical protein [uncultured Aquimonas sp.]ODU42090.1 MAG: hypothetical protein ABS96_29145 [Xanthomonadaceae bacterium SCN 69-123]
MTANLSLRRPPRWVWVVGGLALIGLPLLALALGAAALFGLWQWGSAAVESGRAELTERVPALAAPLEALGAASLDEATQKARALTEEARARLAEGQAALAVDPAQVVDALAPEAAARAAELQAQAEALKSSLPSLAQPLDGLAAEAGAALRAPLQQGGAALAAATAALAALQLPSSDVGGSDPADIPRLPGFVRVAFQRGEGEARVAYAGPAPLREVVDFYRSELSEDGWQVQALESSVAAERLRFERDGRALELVVSADGPRRSRLQWQPAQA